MNFKRALQDSDRAVSPVIGVILMVAITVILSAVIGTFVLGIGDQLGDSAPQASFSTESVTATADDSLSFEIQKTGGQDINPSDLTLVIDGKRIGTVANEGTESNPWQTGATSSFTDDDQTYSAGDVVEISFVHDPSGDIIYQTEETIRES